MRINKFKYTLDFEGWDVKTFGEKELVQAFYWDWKHFLRWSMLATKLEWKKRQHRQRFVYLIVRYKRLVFRLWKGFEQQFIQPFLSKTFLFNESFTKQIDPRNSTNKLLSTVSFEMLNRFFVMDGTNSTSLSKICLILSFFNSFLKNKWIIVCQSQISICTIFICVRICIQ